MKADINANIIGLDSEDTQIMTKEIVEAAQTSFKTIEERKTEMTGMVTDLLNVLCKVVEDFKVFVDYQAPSTQSEDPPETLEVQPNGIAILVPPIRMQVSGGVIDLGTPEFTDVSKSIGQITIDFSLMEMVEVYEMQSVAFVEIKVGEGTLVKQVNPAYTSVKKMKLVVQEAEQKMKT